MSFHKPCLDEVVMTMYGTNAIADSHNIKFLNRSTEPLFLIKAYYDGNAHTGSPKDHFIGILPQLNLTIGIQVSSQKACMFLLGWRMGQWER